MISKEYAAGFTDGEGSVTITLTHAKSGRIVPHVRVSISNYAKEPLELMRQRWGGSLSCGSKSGLWMLCLNGLKAFAFLLDVYPYMHVKHHCAEHALKLYRATDYIVAVQEAIAVIEETRKGGHKDRPDKTVTSLRNVLKEISSGDVPS